MRKARYNARGGFGPDIDSPADGILNEAWDAETPGKRTKLARKALSVDLDCIDAYNILGIHAESHAESIALFREGVRIGERLFAPVLDDEDMAWWGFLGTRPWMRAQHNLGLALMAAGDAKEAAETFKRLLKLNPNDNQGVRTLVMKLSAESGDYSDCRILFADYDGDGSIEFVATKLLVDLASKRKIDFRRHFDEIEASNRYFLPLLATAAKSNRWPRAVSADLIAWGSKEAAAIYLNEFKAAWQRSPKLLAGFLEAYLAQQAKDRT
ncbi:hypothetical protein DEM27_02680 [Metarhizobium album]|uniref:Uncharacterized protein n=1 Tax=Metarhizobium album TaxID=2182425 RepID=A0A2U2DY23_9HYPH|nr:tetratricopeptide repeat protein [Rhizobium album]PWE58109.1 hypothetical protein DEM27_02680 [Rhizobium album]